MLKAMEAADSVHSFGVPLAHGVDLRTGGVAPELGASE